jgi:hypothetical protein
MEEIDTENTYVEIKRWSDYKNALGQLLSYNTAIPKENMSVYFFGIYPEEKKENIIELFIKHKINVHQCVNVIKSETLRLLNHDNTDKFINKHIKQSANRIFCGTAMNLYKEWCIQNNITMLLQKELELKIENYFKLSIIGYILQNVKMEVWV